MLLVIFFASGLLPGLITASVLRGARGRLALTAVGIATLIVYSIYIEGVAACPAQGECDKGIGVVFLAVALIGWLGGIAASWVVRRPRRRV